MLDGPLHITFNCDAVAFGPSSEERFKHFDKDKHNYEEFLGKWLEQEKDLVGKKHEEGPLTNFLQKITYLNNRYSKKGEQPIFKINPLTARGHLAIERGLDILNQFGIESNDTGVFLQNSPKSRYLEIYKPDFFFDDSIRHITGAEKNLSNRACSIS